MRTASVFTMLFIALKVLGYVDWSWIWVLAPIWGSLLMLAGFYAGAAFLWRPK